MHDPKITAPTPGDLLSTLIHASAENILVTDRFFRIINANQAAAELLGYTKMQLVQHHCDTLLSGQDTNDSITNIPESANDSRSIPSSCELVRANGQKLALKTSVEQFAQGKELYFMILLQRGYHTDVGMSVRDTIDTMTGLPGRNTLMEMTTTALLAAQQNNSPTIRRGKSTNQIAIVFVDVDNFKFINETLGHDSGDQIIRQIANKIRDVAMDIGSVARVGVDEFAILIQLPDALNQAHEVARLIGLTTKQPLFVNKRPAHVTTSIGVSSANPKSDAQSLLHQAQIAMYNSRKSVQKEFGIYSQKKHHTIPQCFQA